MESKAPGHVLHVVPTLGPGGLEFALARIINGLLPRGLSHSIVVLKGEAVISDRIDPSVRIHCIHAGAHDPSVPLRLRRLIIDESPSVIHARNLGAWPEIAVARLLTFPLVPLIFSFHGVAEARPVSPRWRFLSRILAKLTTQLFTVSEGSKHFLVDHVGLRERDIAVIPNGVDTARFSPRCNALRIESPLRIGTVGSLSPVKNQALLIRACHRALLQGIDLTLVIAGEGRERPALEKLILTLGITEKVHLLGHVTDTPAFLNSLDIFVLSSDSEAHPNALSEAMACGLPCIASRVGGVAEITDQGRAALLFERGDEEALAAHIADFASAPGKRLAFGKAALDVTLARYSMDVMLSRYLDLYQRIASNGATT
jgi:glycosyltransferase involved in cell wall biosynthesis